MDFEKYPDAW